MLVTLFAALTALAQPPGVVNLHCTVSKPEGPKSIDLTLNEGLGVVTWQWQGEEDIFSKPARFSANKVEMSTISIDRSSLSLVQRSVGADAKERMDTGSCKIVKPTRKF